jgi:hypothetical protein
MGADRPDGVSRQSDAKPQGGRPPGGVRAASRDLRTECNDAERAVKVERDKLEADWISLTEVLVETKPKGGRREGGVSGGCGRSLKTCTAPN